MAKFSTKNLVNKYAGVFKSKNKGTNYSASSFWLDDDFLETESKKKEIDIVKLNGYRRAIGNFVRIVTNRDDINVSYSSGHASYTDGKEVVISAKLNENEFDSTVGLALHEGSHILLTDFKSLPRLYHDVRFTSSDIGIIKDLTNIIEDRRIDNYVYNAAPGYRSYYQALYDRYFNSKDIDRALIENIWNEETVEHYINHICNFVNPNRNLKALAGLETIWNLIDIKRINRLKSTDDSINLAVRVYEEILKNVQEAASGTKPDPKEEGEDPASNIISLDEDATGLENLDNQGGSGSGVDTNADVDPKAQARLDKLAKAAQKALEAQKKFLNGDIRKSKISKKDARDLKAANDSSMSYSEVGGPVSAGENNTIGDKTTKCLVVRGMPDSLLDSGYSALSHIKYSGLSGLENAKKYYQRHGNDPVVEGLTLGVLLGKRLKTRDEIRTLCSSRLGAGSIDKRLISELGYGNDRVFYKKVVDTVKPGLIHISIDASGSMGGKPWDKALKTAVAIAKAASMVQSLECIISVRGSHHAYPVMWIVYDSRKDGIDVIRNKFYAIDANGSTPEGLCFEAIMKDILDSAKGKDMYFINLSDGEPGYSNYEMSYGGEYAYTHTKQQVDKMTRNGINVISYFISSWESCGGGHRAEKVFKRMYGNAARFINVENLNELANSLNVLFERAIA